MNISLEGHGNNHNYYKFEKNKIREETKVKYH